MVRVVSLLPLVTILNPGAEAPWQLWVPALAQNALMTRVLSRKCTPRPWSFRSA